MAEAIRDTNQPQPSRGDLLRLAAAQPDIDPLLAQKLRDIAQSLDALDGVLTAALRGFPTR